jgi:hypothetical protein
MHTYLRNRYAVDLDDFRHQYNATKKPSIPVGSFGLDLNDDLSPVYVVQGIKEQALLCSTRFDDPPCSWASIQIDDFWLLA